MKNISLLLFALYLFLTSCEKEKCKECFIEEVITRDKDTLKRSLGVLCEDKLEWADGRIYRGQEGPVMTYCEGSKRAW